MDNVGASESLIGEAEHYHIANNVFNFDMQEPVWLKTKVLNSNVDIMLSNNVNKGIANMYKQDSENPTNNSITVIGDVSGLKNIAFKPLQINGQLIN